MVKYNILQFTSWPIDEINGVNSTIKELLQTEPYRGSFLLCPSSENPDTWELWQDKVLQEVINFTPLRRKYFGLLDTVQRLLAQPKALITFYKLFRTYKISVFHMHFLSHYGYIFIPLCKLLKINMFVSLHGSDVYRPQNSLIYNFSRYLARKNSMFFSCSKALSLKAIQNLGLNETKIKTIYHGVPQEAKHFTTEKKQNKILAVGRLDPVKGFDILIEAASLLKFKYQQNFTIDIIGDGAEKEKLRQQITQLSLEEHVKLVGAKDRHSLYKDLSEAEIFVLSSRQEGLPISILEALFYRNAVVAADVGGVSEIIDERSGILFPPKNVEKLAHAINELLNDRSKLQDLAHNGNKHCLKKFSWDSSSTDYHSTYSKEVKNI